MDGVTLTQLRALAQRERVRDSDGEEKSIDLESRAKTDRIVVVFMQLVCMQREKKRGNLWLTVTDTLPLLLLVLLVPYG